MSEARSKLQDPLLGDSDELPALRLVITWRCLRYYFVIFLAAMCLSISLSMSMHRAQEHLWNQHLRPEYAHEPLAKKSVRFFDRYLMARAGLDSPATFQANTDRVLSPDVAFESVAWGPGGMPLKTVGRDAWTHSGEEKQFRTAFGNTELFTQMLFFGDNEHATTTSYGTLFWGGELFGMQPPKKWIELRVCDFYRVKPDPAGIYGGLILYNFMMIDWADVMYRADRPVLPPAALQEGLVLPPAANDGVPAPYSILAAGRNVAEARAVTEEILTDWVDLGAARSWHPNMTFYGPRGLGLAKGVVEFREHILKPFQAAFANRSLEKEIFTCEGNYCAAMGHIRGIHVASWLGLPKSSKQVRIRFGMHWRIMQGQAVEGWAIFDVPGFFRQLGFDFFASASRGSLQPLTPED